MAKYITGEMDVVIDGRRHSARPSFGLLYELEQQSGQAIPQLLTALRNASCAPSHLAILFETMLLSASPSALPAAHAANNDMAQAAELFLVRGLGYDIADGVPPDCPAIDWVECYKIACGIFSIPEAQFWRMTMHGFRLCCEGFAAFHQLDENDAPSPPAKSDVLRMMAAHPDFSKQ